MEQNLKEHPLQKYFANLKQKEEREILRKLSPRLSDRHSRSHSIQSILKFKARFPQKYLDIENIKSTFNITNEEAETLILEIKQINEEYKNGKFLIMGFSEVTTKDLSFLVKTLKERKIQTISLNLLYQFCTSAAKL